MSTSTERDLFDCIVIGAGVQGSFTAYSLAKRGKRTLLLEQFVLPHSRGSSHGQTRIIRKAYEQDFYTHMMEECYGLWRSWRRRAESHFTDPSDVSQVRYKHNMDGGVLQAVGRAVEKEGGVKLYRYKHNT
ncbi:hypothetical protein WMY93_028889 [Mugilogobius chulae]|uniref:FAD dependent oxidoreductase domain-containing protein n=1 Tax=Mugilogobius chulae TaxID=88201 RepID=A0AAW0MT31_9GOBI